jgi:hypothetical protein
MLGYLSPSKGLKVEDQLLRHRPRLKSHLQVAPIPGPRQRPRPAALSGSHP